jgi:hypothetical protein
MQVEHREECAVGDGREQLGDGRRLGRAMQSQLFQERPSDPAAVVASLVPARRAARVDPAAALRQE